MVTKLEQCGPVILAHIYHQYLIVIPSLVTSSSFHTLAHLAGDILITLTVDNFIAHSLSAEKELAAGCDYEIPDSGSLR